MLGDLDHQAGFEGGIFLPCGRGVSLHRRIAFGDDNVHRLGHLDPDHLVFQDEGANALEVVGQVAGLFTVTIDRQSKLIIAVHVHEVQVAGVPVEELYVPFFEVRLARRISAAEGLVDLLLGSKVPCANFPDGVSAAR